jgi:3'-phosphoadenosine 5'-phosphosulfate sulfotransferase (PAPS reductase)/FAD synthetase
MKVFEKLENPVTHIICYSGGHSSAKVAMNVFSKMRDGDTIMLLNHDINSNVEHLDIKRFKKEVANHIGVEITYANYQNKSVSEIPDQFDVCVSIKGFKFGKGTELCTYQLKTLPFEKYLKQHFPVIEGQKREDVIIYYGFDKEETSRITRRSSILGNMGYYTDFPLALWDDADHDILENAGILPPLTYKQIDGENTYGAWKHANCIGCLKAGKQHWYAVYCARPDLFEKAKWAEEELDHSIINGVYMYELEPVFEEMKLANIPATENIDGRTFWAMARKVLKGSSADEIFKLAEYDKPCECVI